MKIPIALVSQLGQQEQSNWIELLRKALPAEKIERASDLTKAEKARCEFVIVANPTSSQLAEFTQLRWVHSLWAGVENLVPLAKERSFDIVRMTDPKLAETMAEAVLAWSLYVHRKMPSYSKQQRDKQWKPLLYKEAADTTVGILGMGRLGKASAQQLARNGFNVIGWRRTQKQDSKIKCYFGENGLNLLLPQVDILVCLLPLTESTHGMVHGDHVNKLPQGASVINFARGPIIDNKALVEALNSGHLYHAVLDVFEQEPLPQESSLWQHPQVTVLPHISAVTSSTTALEVVAKNIRLYRATGELPTVVSLDKGY
jgi:glyoxylate/hydroxypyruvate reductase A